MAEDILGLGKGFDLLKEVLSLLKYVYEEYKNHKGNKREQQDDFLNSASEALRQTLIYIGTVPYERDGKKEEELSRLWSKVALAARPLNPDLAARCHIKASYWANPERWTDEQLDAAEIEIGLMEKEIGKLFGGKDKRSKNK